MERHDERAGAMAAGTVTQIEAGSSAPWGGQYSIRTQQFRVAAEALQALKELALLNDPVEGGLCSRVTRLFVQCKGGVHQDQCANP